MEERRTRWGTESARGFAIIDALATDGFVLLPAVFTADEVESARRACDQALAADDAAVLANGGRPYGARNLLSLWPGVMALARSPRLADRLREVLGPTAGVVRGLYFDKPPGNSWALPWHRDLTVAVKAHREPGRFRHPTTKAGVPHMEAPVEVLSAMLTARIHLDAATADNGPLRVAPGSHAAGLPAGGAPVEVRSEAGDVLLMRPLLLHASGHSSADAGHRRVVHLECAPWPVVPEGFEWHTFVPLSEA